MLKHVFTNVLQMTEKKLYYGKEEEHFGVTWLDFQQKKEKYQFQAVITDETR